MSVSIWYLKKGAEKRILAGHPWVFTGELSVSPKELEPGAMVELRSHKDEFLALGYGNPRSQICFRALSFKPGGWGHPQDVLAYRLNQANSLRQRLGAGGQSYRIAFSEADGLPGLIVDRFLLTDRRSQVLVVQVLTYGMQRLLGDLAEFLQKFLVLAASSSLGAIGWEHTAIVTKNSSRLRTLEGLEIEAAVLIKDLPGINWNEISILAGPWGLGDVEFKIDLFKGQKTGFFLDQSWNLNLLLQALGRGPAMDLKVLDLFSYVGQWGSTVSKWGAKEGQSVEVHLADASAEALSQARDNVEVAGGRAQCFELDLVRDFGPLGHDFDVVICDPPAFMKSRKDIPTGRKAYIKVNQQALSRVKRGGIFVSCSCSHHLSESDFLEVLGEAERRAKVQVRWLFKGQQAPDHPRLMAFPEGQYLKSWVGQVG